MKKLSNKGFMLTETLIVATMLITVLLVMYLQFKVVMRSYNNSFKYNTVNNLHSLYNVKQYIERENYNIMATKLNSAPYVELSTCSDLYFNNTSYCSQLFDSLRIEELYLVKENVKEVLQANKFTSDFEAFVRTIESDKSSGYRLLAKFTDNTFGTLKVLSGQEYENFIANSCQPNKKVKFTVTHKLLETNQDIIEPVKSEEGCSKTIPATKYVYKDNPCFYPTNFSTNEITMGLDETANALTIYYGRYESNLTINYYEKGTTTSVAPSVTINAYCGYKTNIDKYKKAITNRQIVSVSEDDIELTKTDKVVNIFYTPEGGTVYED